MTALVRYRGLAPLALLLAVAACWPAEATRVPTVDPHPAVVVIGCVSIEAAECTFVAEQVAARLPMERGRPFAFEITLFGCNGPAVCPKTLAFRGGIATVEYADGGDPVSFAIAGPPANPGMDLRDVRWSGSIQPSSPRAVGAGPFPFVLGHCGLSHVVDFDGSFWVAVGQVDGEAPGMINRESGRMNLLGPNLAQYTGPTGLVAQLARFPGAKRFFLCD